ncbi:hypothetical protein NL676_002468 [Syzygium grande]|nr:hypothetical protein NL676_002468 [Syzygium grande]
MLSSSADALCTPSIISSSPARRARSSPLAAKFFPAAKDEAFRDPASSRLLLLSRSSLARQVCSSTDL